MASVAEEALVDQGGAEVQGEAAVAVAVVVAEIDGNHKLHTPLE
jgi:tellurite resistance protein